MSAGERVVPGRPPRAILALVAVQGTISYLAGEKRGAAEDLAMQPKSSARATTEARGEQRG